MGGISANAFGDKNEVCLASVFWDVYDDVDDDYSSQYQWRHFQYSAAPDGIGDSLSMSLSDILDVCRKEVRLGMGPLDVAEFWYAWFEPGSSNGHEKAMHDVFYEHGLTCCVGQMRGNVDGDYDDMVNIVDMNFFVDYFYNGGPLPPCPYEADVNGDGAMNVVDMTYLTAYLFTGGDAPVGCPDPGQPVK